MALFFPWATKEYLLWEMTIGQIIMYHNKAMDIKNGVNEKSSGLLQYSAEELRKMRDDAKSQADELAKAEKEMARKFGDIK